MQIVDTPFYLINYLTRSSFDLEYQFINNN